MLKLLEYFQPSLSFPTALSFKVVLSLSFYPISNLNWENPLGHGQPFLKCTHTHTHVRTHTRAHTLAYLKQTINRCLHYSSDSGPSMLAAQHLYSPALMYMWGPAWQTGRWKMSGRGLPAQHECWNEQEKGGNAALEIGTHFISYGFYEQIHLEGQTHAMCHQDMHH